MLCTLPAIFRIIQVGIRRNLYTATGSFIDLVAAFTFPVDTIKWIASKIAVLGHVDRDTLFLVRSIALTALPAKLKGFFYQIPMNRRLDGSALPLGFQTSFFAPPAFSVV